MNYSTVSHADPANNHLDQDDYNEPQLRPFQGHPLPETFRVLLLIVGVVAWANGVFGNILIICTLLTQRSLRSLHHLYIGNLAVADLIISVYIVPFWLLDLLMGRSLLSAFVLRC
jgi:hypothetical protein